MSSFKKGTITLDPNISAKEIKKILKLFGFKRAKTSSGFMFTFINGIKIDKDFPLVLEIDNSNGQDDVNIKNKNRSLGVIITKIKDVDST